MDPIIYADLRCLQDPNYRVRGIGHHVSALLRTRKQSSFSSCKLIALLDPQWPKLPDEYAPFVDEVTFSLNPICNGTPSLFIDGTPMTHDPRFSLRFLAHPGFLSAAVIYDFIPLDWPGYLPTVASRIDYLAKLARLRKFQFFLPISQYSAWRTSDLLGVPKDRIHVTGAPVRRSLYEIRRRSRIHASVQNAGEPYFVIVIASDPRKNPEVAVKAVRRLNLLHSRRIPLKVIGHFDERFKRRLLPLAGHEENGGFLEFQYNISDEELASMFAGATATIVPSHIEGFSLPVVEASLFGCPVVASACAAHLELIERPEALFQSDDSVALSERLDALINEPSLRGSLAASQAYLADRFHEDSVGKRFWNAIESSMYTVKRSTRFTKTGKPRLAFLSPYPPDRSAAARYTAMAIKAGESFFHPELYTDAVRPLSFPARFRDAGGVSIAPFLQGRYNGIVSVLGNHSSDARIFQVFEQFGGPCILHDVQLTDTLFHALGESGFLAFTSRLLDRQVGKEEANVWLRHGNPPRLFIDSIINRASPLMVHTEAQKALLKKQYGVEPQVLTSCPAAFFEDEELTPSAKQSARQRRGIPSSVFLVSTFGNVDRGHGVETYILAAELLQSWNIPAELYFVNTADSLNAEIRRIAQLYGIAEHVHVGSDLAGNAIYRDFLIGSDAAVQLRDSGFGRPCTNLQDCISAGLSSVVNSELAQACDAPDYVLSVPDYFSPLQVAEQLASIWELRSETPFKADLRHKYLQAHSFECYARRLIEILGIV